jgi:hypothetical protein
LYFLLPIPPTAACTEPQQQQQQYILQKSPRQTHYFHNLFAVVQLAPAYVKNKIIESLHCGLFWSYFGRFNLRALWATSTAAAAALHSFAKISGRQTHYFYNLFAVGRRAA